MKALSLALLMGVLTTQSLQAELQSHVASTTAPSTNASKGFYQYQFGKYKIVALLDGTNQLNRELFNKNIENEERLKLFEQLGIKGALPTSVNAFLIDDGQSVMLVDSGAASCFGPHLGSVVKNIEAAGYKPFNIQTVFLTHLHPDHVCGIAKDGLAVFPLANLYVHEDEVQYWLNPNTLAAIPTGSQDKFKATVAQIEKAVAPYKQNRTFRTFKDGAIINGLEVINSAGHTPGHRSFKLTNGNDQFVFLGDVVHTHQLQFEQPMLAVEFDVEPVKAAETRKRIFDELARKKAVVAAAHLPFPGIGHIEFNGNLKYKCNKVFIMTS